MRQSTIDKYKAMAGRRYGRLTLTGECKRLAPKSALLLLCKCDCGSEAWYRMGNVCFRLSSQCEKCGRIAAGRTNHNRRLSQYMEAGAPVAAVNGHVVHLCECGRAKGEKFFKTCKRCTKPRRKPDKYPFSLTAVGKAAGVTRERVRQVVAARGWEGMLAFWNLTPEKLAEASA